MQYDRTSGFPGRKSTSENYLLMLLDNEPVFEDWERFYRVDLSNWEGSTEDERIKLLLDVLQNQNVEQLSKATKKFEKTSPPPKEQVKTVNEKKSLNDDFQADDHVKNEKKIIK